MKNLAKVTFTKHLGTYFILTLVLLCSQQILAASPSSGITYSGRILDANDQPVVASQVIFNVTVYDPDLKCWLYTEQRQLDMSASAGSFAFEIGSNDPTTLIGTPAFNNPSGGGPKTLAEVFNNNKSFTNLDPSPNCASRTYSPNTSTDPHEGRVLGIFFRIGFSGADQALPPLRVSPVPMALHAFESNKLNGYDQNHLLRIDPSITSPVNSDLDATKLAEFFRLLNNPNTAYLAAIPTLGGDVSGTLPAMSVDKIKGYAVATPAGAGDNGKVLTFNSVTGWSLQVASVTPGDSSYAAKGILQFDTSAEVSGVTVTAGVAKLNTGTAANQIVQLDGTAKLPAVDGSQLTAVVVPDSSITSTKIFDGTIVNSDISGTAAIAWSKIASPTTLAAYGITDAVNKTGDTMGGALAMGGFDLSNSGNITMAANKYLGLSANTTNGTVAGQMWYDTGTIKYYDGSTVKSLGVAGAGITSLNGLSAGTQTFAIGTSGTAPAFNSATSTHTLDIPMASTATVTAGLLSKADYDTFNAKLGTALNGGKVWVGNASNVATEQTLSGDISAVSNTGSVTVDKTQAAVASKILQLTASSVAVTKGTDIGGAGAGVAHILYPNTATDTTLTLPSTAGSASQFLQTDGSGNLTWAAPAASLPGLTSTQVWVGNASGVAAPVALSGDITSITNAGAVTTNKTTTAQANKLLALDGSGVAVTMGNQLNGLTSGSLTLQPAAVTTNYSLTFPGAQGAAGQTLSNNGSGVLSWASTLTNALTSGNILVGNASNIGSAVSMSGDATMDNAGAVTLKNTGTPGTYGSASLVPIVTTDAQGRVTSVTTAAPLDATKLPLAGGTMSGAIAMGAQDITNTGHITMAANKYLGLSANTTNGTVAGQMWYDTGTIKYFDGTFVKSLGVAGAGITSLNGLSAGTQTFAIGTSGTAPAFNSATSTHTLDIPMASTAAVTAGLLSKADYDTFNAKLGAVTNTATLAPTKIWIGDVSSKAQEFALSGDATMTSGGVVTVDKTQAGAASKILQLTASSVAVTKGEDIGGASTGKVSLRYPSTATDTTLTFPNTAGSASQFLQTDGSGNLTWAAPAASLPGLTSTQVWVGNASGVAAPVALSGDISSITNAGAVTANKTTTAEANKLLALDGSGVAVTMGNQLNGLTSGSLTLQPAAVTTNYSLTFPGAQGAAGQTLSNNGSGVLSWASTLTDALTSGKVLVGNGSNLAAAVSLSGDATMDNAGAVTLKNTGTAGTYGSASLVPIVTTDAQGRVTSLTTAAPLDATKLPLAGGTMTGAIAMGAQDITNTGHITMAANKYLGLSANTTNGTVAGQMWYDTGTIKYYDGSTVKSLGIAGAGITSFNGLGAGTQTFAIGTSGTAPAFNSATSTHTLDIPMASTAAVTAGLLSKADYDTFNAKLGAVTNTATLAPTKIWIGDVGSKAQEFALSGDATMTSGGVVTVDKTQGAVASKILQLTAGSVAVTKGEDIGGASTGKVSLRYPSTAIDTTLTFPSSAGSASQFLQTDGSGNLTWAAPAASLPGLTSTQVWVGNASGVAAPVALSGDITGITNAGAVTVNKTTTAESNKLLSLDGSSVATAAGVALVNTGTVTLSAQTASSTYGLKWPAAAPAASQSLQSDASGNMSWVSVLSSTNGWAKDGNSFGAKATLGTTDNFDLGFITNNTERMTILNSGYVGIGTTNPQRTLHVSTDDAGTPSTFALQNVNTTNGNGLNLSIRGVTTGAAPNTFQEFGALRVLYEDHDSSTFSSSMKFYTAASGALATRLAINSSGNVGIGTTTPSSLLDLSSTTGAVQSLSRNNSTVTAADSIGKIQFWNNDAQLTTQNVYGNIEVLAAQTITTDAAAGNMIFRTTGTTVAGSPVERMRIDSAGNVGIGTASPTGRFEVYGGAPVPSGSGASFLLSNAVTGGAGGPAQLTGGYGGNGYSGGAVSINGGQTQGFGGTIGNVLLSTTGGNVGIGTTTPTTGTRLDITGTGTAASSIIIPRDTVANRPTIGVNGMLRYASDTNKFEVYENGAWVNLVSSTNGTVTSIVAGSGLTGGTITSTGTIAVDSTSTGTASKILQLDASSVAVTKGVDIGGASTGKASLRYPSTATDTTLTFPSTAGSASQFLQTDGAGNLTWAAPAASLPGLTSTQVWVGNASGVAAPVALSGDITGITNAGAVTANKTTTAESNKLLSLDGSGVATAAGVALVNTGTVTLSAQTASSTYGLKWPAAAPAANQSLQSDASGNMTWVSALTSTSGWAKDGNAFGAKATVGNTDNFDLGFITNNTEKMTILSTGNVGIGTTSPGFKLDVVGNARVGQYISYNQTGAPAKEYRVGANGDNSFSIYDDSLDTDRFSISTTGVITAKGDFIANTNVGIGTATSQAGYIANVNGGLYSTTSTTSAAALSGINSDTTTANYGVYGNTSSAITGTNAVYGVASGAGYVQGVRGITTNSGGYGVGVSGESAAGGGGASGIAGKSTYTGGNQVYGGHLICDGTACRATFGEATRGTGTSYGGYFTAASTGAGTGIYAAETGAGNTGYAAYFSNSSATGWTLYANGTSPNYFASKVGIGTSTPSAKLEVQGQIVSKVYDNGAATTFDLNNGNSQYTSASCGAMTLQNMVDGGSYTVAVQGATSGTCTFTDSTGSRTFKFAPANGATTASSHTVYSMQVMGSFVYVSWISGF